MHISYAWLKQFADIKDAPADIASRLTHVGFALESLQEKDADTVFDFDVPTNRPDCLSHLGIAREVSAIYGTPLVRPKFELREGGKDTSAVFSISIADPDLCSRYCGRYIAGVKIGPSPDWLKARLEALGQRSINNVADATNYVMLELGQPLHAFDADTLHGQQIIVRRADFDEKITTLDGVERKLDPSVLLIADKDRGVAVAGVMGGAETEISTGTTNVLLESATFNPLSIRKTSRTIGLASEASYRFERGSDIKMARYACDRAAALIQELAGGTVYRGVIDVYPEKAKPNSHVLRRQRIEGFLGAPVDDKIVEGIFERLDFKIARNAARDADGWTIEAPTHRVDIGGEEDLLEEIARHHGFDKFPMTLPEWNGFGAGLPWESQERRLRNALSASGYTEIYTYSFSDEQTEQKYRPGIEPVKFQNPMTEDATILRTSLVPGVLKTIQWNVNRGTRDLQLFELSKVYSKGGERRSLILAACGDLRPQGVHDAQRQVDFFDIKGDIEALMEMFGVELQLTAKDLPAYYHPGRSARIGDLATFGEVHPEYVEPFKLRQRVYIAEIDVEALLSTQRTQTIQQPSRFPAIRRDFSLLVDKGTQYDAIQRTIAGIGIRELAGVAPFDRMETGSFAEGKYSLSISVLYQSAERTLTDAEVEGFDQRILQTLEQRVGAQLRK